MRPTRTYVEVDLSTDQVPVLARIGRVTLSSPSGGEEGAIRSTAFARLIDRYQQASRPLSQGVLFLALMSAAWLSFLVLDRQAQRQLTQPVLADNATNGPARIAQLPPHPLQSRPLPAEAEVAATGPAEQAIEAVESAVDTTLTSDTRLAAAGPAASAPPAHYPVTEGVPFTAASITPIVENGPTVAATAGVVAVPDAAHSPAEWTAWQPPSQPAASTPSSVAELTGTIQELSPR